MGEFRFNLCLLLSDIIQTIKTLEGFVIEAVQRDKPKVRIMARNKLTEGVHLGGNPVWHRSQTSDLVIFQEDVMHCCQCVKKRRRKIARSVAQFCKPQSWGDDEVHWNLQPCHPIDSQHLWNVNRIRDAARVLATEKQHWLAKLSNTFATCSGDPSGNKVTPQTESAVAAVSLQILRETKLSKLLYPFKNNLNVLFLLSRQIRNVFYAGCT